MRAWIGAWIAAGRSHRQPAEVMRPTCLVKGTLCGIRQAAMGHAQQRAALPLDQVDLDQADPGGTASLSSQPKL
jgi:hypothetical protein